MPRRLPKRLTPIEIIKNTIKDMKWSELVEDLDKINRGGYGQTRKELIERHRLLREEIDKRKKEGRNRDEPPDDEPPAPRIRGWGGQVARWTPPAQQPETPDDQPEPEPEMSREEPKKEQQIPGFGEHALFKAVNTFQA